MEFSVIDSIYVTKIPVKVLEAAIVVERDYPAPTGAVGTSYVIDSIGWSTGTLTLHFSSWTHDHYVVRFSTHKRELTVSVLNGSELSELKTTLAEYIYKVVSFSYKNYLRITGDRIQTVDTAYCPTGDAVPARLLQAMLDNFDSNMEFWANDFSVMLIGKSLTDDEYYFIDDSDIARVFSYKPNKWMLSSAFKNPHEGSVDIATATRILLSYREALEARSKQQNK